MTKNMFTIRKISPAEIDGLLTMTAHVGWNVSRDDALLMCHEQHSAVLLAYLDSELAGSACWIAIDGGKQICINLVTVKDCFRRHGLATALIQEIFRLNPQAKTFRLLATEAGSYVYAKLGFISRKRVFMFTGPADSINNYAAPLPVVSLTDGLPQWVIDMDAQSFAPGREFFLREINKHNPQMCLALPEQRGFILDRSNGDLQISAMMETTNLRDALGLLAAYAAQAPGRQLEINVPETQEELCHYLHQIGFKIELSTTEMLLGDIVPPAGLQYYAAGGLDIG